MFKALVLAFLLATPWSTAAGETRWISGANAPRVGIFLDFDRDPSQSSLRIMQREVGAALAATGAQFSWLTLNQDARSETFDQLAVLRFRGNCHMETMALPAADATPMTLGETGLVSGEVSAYSSVECDPIKSCISGLLAGSCPRDRETAFGRALARVVAHELYHVLANTTEHSRSGIAKSLQNSFDLVKENLQFDRQALLWLRQRLFSMLSKSAISGQLSAVSKSAISGQLSAISGPAISGQRSAVSDRLRADR